jgi:hypothetical protein
MANRIDWDEVSRKQRAQRHGIEYAFDELPPIGTYADQMRNADADSNKLRPLEKTQPKSKADRMIDLKKTLLELVDITDTKEWSKRSDKYQNRVLNKMQKAVINLINLDPSAVKDPCCIKAKRLLFSRIRNKSRQMDRKPIGIYGSSSPQIRGFKK